MKKAVWSGIIALSALFALSTPVFAQNTAAVTVTVTVAAKAKLTVSASAITFADADPDVLAQIPANTPLDITVKARTSAGGSVALTVAADREPDRWFELDRDQRTEVDVDGRELRRNGYRHDADSRWFCSQARASATARRATRWTTAGLMRPAPTERPSTTR